MTETTDKRPQYFRRELLAGDTGLGWGEIPNNIPMDYFARLMADRERDAPQKLTNNLSREKIEQAGLWSIERASSANGRGSRRRLTRSSHRSGARNTHGFTPLLGLTERS